MIIEVKKQTQIKKDPKIYTAIIALKVLIKQKAKNQKQRRLAKLQKDPYERSRITGLHRIYLKLRGKDENAHRLPEDSGRYSAAVGSIRKFLKEYDLEDL